MKNYSRTIILFLSLSTTLAFGHNPDLPFGNISSFESDGCSYFPDGTVSEPTLWRHCCVNHDRSYWMGGSQRDRLRADRRLRECVTNEGHTEVAELMYNGVRAGGSPYYKTSFRWGFGWDKMRGYHSLTKDERLEVKRALREQRN